MSSGIGVLLLNLGTPKSTKYLDVAKYLKQFLQDKRVITLPSLFRWLLVNCIIVPFRAKKTARAYRKIWQATGSPLLLNSNLLKDKLQKQLGGNFLVALGMTYGKPTISDALEKLVNCKKIIVLPLFPQYSSSASGAPLEQVLNLIAKQLIIPELIVIANYYNDPKYLRALVNSVRPFLNKNFDFLITSYHGLPESAKDASYYKEQCLKTSAQLSSMLGLPANKWGISFQSRLGRLPWIKPYTDELLKDLAKQGLKKLLIVCPSFAVDCLETLEEIALGCREQWQKLGGESLELIPCLNANPTWVSALAELVCQGFAASSNSKVTSLPCLNTST